MQAGGGGGHCGIGDAGFGLSVEWNAPEGVTVSPFRYPVPEPLILFGMMNHVYEHPYALLADVKVDKSVAPGTDLTLTGIANWLACTDKICVPEKSIVSVALKAGDGTISAASRDRVDAWRGAWTGGRKQVGRDDSPVLPASPARPRTRGRRA